MHEGRGAPVEGEGEGRAEDAGPASWPSHLAATLTLGLPLVGAQLAQVAINVTDTVTIGWLGAEELAAAVLATQGFFLVWIFGVGFTQAVMPLAANAEGRGDVRGVRRSVRMGLWVVVLYGAAAMGPLWRFEPILLALGQEAHVAALAGRFMRVLQWSIFPALFVAGIRSYLSVLGRARVVLTIVIVGAAVNAGLNYVLVFGHFGAPRLGMTGSALASLGTNMVMAGIMLAYTLRSPGLARYEIYRRLWRPDWPAFLEVLRLGWPIAVAIIAEVSLFTAASVMMGWLGAIELAAHGIALQLASISFMIPLGFANAATVRAGIAYGRRDWTALRRGAGAALGLSTLLCGLAALVFWAIPAALIGLYLDKAQPNARGVLEAGIPLVLVAAAFQVVDGVQVVASGLLRGLKDTRTPMLIALFSYWGIGMPVAYLLGFPLGFGGVGLWWGLAAGLSVAAVLMTGRFYRRLPA